MLKGFDYGYIKKFDKLALAVSGGRDSMVMLDAVSSVVDKDSFFVITVHHNLRGDEGKRDRDFVAQYCREIGVKCEIYEEDIPSFCAENGYTVEQDRKSVV